MNKDRLMIALFERAPQHLVEHIILVGTVLAIGIAIAVPIGIFLTRPRFKKFSDPIMFILNTGQTIPPLAVIAMFLPLLGIGFKAALYALVIYGLLPIARNTLAGLSGVNLDVKEAARGMGMSAVKVFLQVELPLALPVILAGIRTSTVLTVSTATLAGLIGAGGLGRLINAGLAMKYPEYLLVGAGLGALLAIFIDRIMNVFERKFGPPGPTVEIE